MGEHADDILNGDVDEHTGEYIGPGDGYPRSYFNAKKETGNPSIQKSTKRVVEYFKDYSCQELDGGGLNIKIPGNGTVTVWWRKGKWTHSKKANKWFYFRNSPKEHANELIAQIEGFMAVNVEPSVKVVDKAAETTTPRNKVQDCIDHLLKKAETIGKAQGADHKSATLLKMTAQELIQYL